MKRRLRIIGSEMSLSIVKSACIIAAFFFSGTWLRSSAQQLPDSDGNNILARIGPRTITVQDFWERMELMPWPGKDKAAEQDSAKIKALISLVGEKLLSMQAADQGFIDNPTTSAELKALERLFARDELYRTEVSSNVSVQENETEAGFVRYATTLQLNTYVMNSENAARQLVAALNDTSIRSSPPSLTGVLSHDTITASFGDLPPSYEDAVYSIDARHKALIAYAPEHGWTVFQLLDSYTNPAYANATMVQRQTTVHNKLRKRKEHDRVLDFGRSIFTRQTRMDSTVFLVLADSLLSIMRRDSAAHRQEGSYGVLGNDIDILKRALTPFRSRAFITMGGYSIGVDEMLDELKFHPLSFQSLRKRQFFQILNRDCQQIAEAALFSQEALKRRMHRRPRAQHDLNVWVDAKQSDKLLTYLLDSLRRTYDDPASSAGLEDSLGHHTATRSVEAFNRYLGGLATKFGLAIDFHKLRQVSLTPSNMVTKRFIGFGGAMMAVPTIPFLWHWFDTWNKGETISP